MLYYLGEANHDLFFRFHQINEVKMVFFNKLLPFSLAG